MTEIQRKGSNTAVKESRFPFDLVCEFIFLRATCIPVPSLPVPSPWLPWLSPLHELIEPSEANRVPPGSIEDRRKVCVVSVEKKMSDDPRLAAVLRAVLDEVLHSADVPICTDSDLISSAEKLFEVGRIQPLKLIGSRW